MKTDFYFGKHLSFHITVLSGFKGIWAFNLLPFFEISDWRIFCGWLFFSLQYAYEAIDEDYLEEYE